MRSLICLSIAALFAAPAPAEAQLFRRWRYCPPVQQDIITISPPAAPTAPEVPYYPIQAIPQPVPMPVPHGGGNNTSGPCDDGANMATLLMMKSMLENKNSDIFANTEALKMMMLMKQCDVQPPFVCDDDDDGDEEILAGIIQGLLSQKREEADDDDGDKEIIAALIQAMMAKRGECPQPTPPAVIQPVPVPQPATFSGVSCESLLRMLMGNK